MLDQLLTDDAGNGWQLYIRLVDHDIEQVAQQTRGLFFLGDPSFIDVSPFYEGLSPPFYRKGPPSYELVLTH